MGRQPGGIVERFAEAGLPGTTEIAQGFATVTPNGSQILEILGMGPGDLLQHLLPEGMGQDPAIRDGQTMVPELPQTVSVIAYRRRISLGDLMQTAKPSHTEGKACPERNTAELRRGAKRRMITPTSLTSINLR